MIYDNLENRIPTWFINKKLGQIWAAVDSFSDNYLHIEKETEKAILVRVDTLNKYSMGKKLTIWVPKSVLLTDAQIEEEIRKYEINRKKYIEKKEAAKKEKNENRKTLNVKKIKKGDEGKEAKLLKNGEILTAKIFQINSKNVIIELNGKKLIIKNDTSILGISK